MEPEQNRTKHKFQEYEKPLEPSLHPPLHSEFSFYSLNQSDQEAFCSKCQYILLKCELLGSLYCESCNAFVCLKCKKYFNKKSTCKCFRCTCCFLEECLSQQKIGKQCQNLCHICYEENDPTSYNISRYPCGHGICRICLFNYTLNENFDPQVCYICEK